MNPVIIFRHAASEGPGFLGTFLDERQIPWRVLKIDEGEPLPASIAEYSGVALMGGPMSVNDDLPWIPTVLALIREAVALDIPLLGHCLGGQLISSALGAEVTVNPVKEIGWGKVKVNQPAAKLWFGDAEEFEVFHWHGETFSLPADAVHLLSSEYCKNQAYAIGKHLALQCHIEMTSGMVNQWGELGASEITASNSPAVQTAAEMAIDLDSRISGLHKVARLAYERWITGLKG